MSDSHFFVQPKEKELWHVESDENCEVMLCGLYISVDWDARISQRWGPRKCPDCWMRLEELHRIEAIAPHRALSRIPSRSRP